MEIVVTNPQIASHIILGLPVLERTFKVLKRCNPNLEIKTTNQPTGRSYLRGDWHYDPDLLEKIAHGQVSLEGLEEKFPQWVEVLDGSEAAYQRAEKKLFKNIRRKTPGWIASTLNKTISFFITRFLLKTSITPNQITVFNLLFGIASGLLLGSLDYTWRLVGGIGIQLSSVLDGCDGEVARLKQMFSKNGAWLDTIADDLSNNAGLIGLSVGLYRSTANALYLYVGLIVLCLSVAVTAMIYHQLRIKKTGNAKDFVPEWQKEEKHWFEYIRPIMKRDFFIFVMMILVILDFRHSLFILSAIGGTATFLFYFPSFVMTALRQRHSQ